MKVENFVISAEDFEIAMQEVDAVLKSKNLKISGRELHGLSAFCDKYQIEALDLNHPLALQILNWFKGTYGTRLNMQNVIGTTVILVKGDLYTMPCYLAYGKLSLICSAEKMGVDLEPRITTGPKPPLINILEYVTELTKKLALRLTLDERNTILVRYVAAIDLFKNWSAHHAMPFMLEAMSDFEIAVDCLVTRPNYGMAKWSYLQATEKVLKSYLQRKAATFKRTHSLLGLSQAAESVGLPVQPRHHLAEIQCEPGVRYDASIVKREEAYTAHVAAMVVISNILFALNSKHWTTWDALSPERSR